MKNIKKYVLIVFLLFVSFIKADALSVSKNNLIIEHEKNPNIDLYTNTDKLFMRLTNNDEENKILINEKKFNLLLSIKNRVRLK